MSPAVAAKMSAVQAPPSPKVATVAAAQAPPTNQVVATKVAALEHQTLQNQATHATAHAAGAVNESAPFIATVDIFAPLVADPFWGTSLFNAEPFRMLASPAMHMLTHHREQLSPRLDVDIRETPTHFEIEASCPGVTKKDVTLEVDPARHELYLRITKAGHDEKNEQRLGFVQHVSERWSGSASRTLRLPRYSDLTAVHSRVEHGVLHISVGKIPEAAAHTGRHPVTVA